MGRKTAAQRALVKNAAAARASYRSNSPEDVQAVSNDPPNEPATRSEPIPPSCLLENSTESHFDHQTTSLDDHELNVPRFSNSRVDSNQSELTEPPEDGQDDETDVGNDGDRYVEDSEGEDEGSETSDAEEDEPAPRVDNQPIPITAAETVIIALEKIVADAKTGRGKHKSSKLDDVTLYRIRLMTATLRLRCSLDCGMMKASELAAAMEGRGSWTARRVRQWIRHFQATEMLPENLYGGRWNESIIDDAEFRCAIKVYLRQAGKYAQARDVVDFFNTPAGEEWRRRFGSQPALRTAQSWMDKLGFDWGRERRGQYADGHERLDVVEYRMKYYIPEWFKNAMRMRSWDEDGKDIPPLLEVGQRIVVKWFHDESTFFAHDRRCFVWNERGMAAGIQKKGEGLSMMVADFVSPDYGWLRGRDDINAQVIFRAGKHRDGYFCSHDVVKQFLHAMEIVKDQYPNEDHVFIYDNATIHAKMPDDAPNVGSMTLGASKNVKAVVVGPSGEQTKINMAPARFSDGSPQELYYPMDFSAKSLRGQFKGLTKLLEERGIVGARKLRLQCPKDKTRPGCPLGRTDCCARRTMANQSDFLDRKTALQLIAEEHGCSVIYLPKYHCELNPIEQCWGAAKRVYRTSPFSSAEADLRQNMLAALESVPLKSIRRFAARSQRFLYAYRDGISGEDAVWAQKLYHGHRIITEAVMNGTGPRCRATKT